MSELLTVAFHEAGHCVAQHVLGASIQSIELEGRVAKDGTISWSGQAPFHPNGMSNENAWIIMLAGGLAEAKYECITAFAKRRGHDFLKVCKESRITLQTTCIESILRAMSNGVAFCRTNEASLIDKSWADVHVEIDDENQRANVFFGECADDMNIAQQRCAASETDLSKAIFKAAEFVNQRSYWAAICDLAMQLSTLEPRQFVRKELSRELAISTICSATAQDS